MSRKKSHNDVMRINKILLRCIGVLPLGGVPTSWKTASSFFFTAFALFCNNVIVAPLIHLLVFTPSGMVVSFEVLFLLISVLGGQIQMLIVIINRRKVQRLLSISERLWADEASADYKILIPWANRGTFLSLALLTTTFMAAELYLLVPIMETLSGNSTARSLPFQINMNTSLSPQYEITYVVQAIAVQNCALAVIGCDSTVVMLILNGCGQLKLIQNWLCDMSAEKADMKYESGIRKSCEETLRKCVKRHQIVLDYCMELEELVNNINLVKVLTWMYVIAFAIVNLFGKNELQGGAIVIKAFASLCIGICQLLFLCWPSQELSSASIEIANSVYDVPWNLYSKCDQTVVTIMLMRSQRPAILTAGKFVELSLDTFSNIISSAGSFSMVLLSL